MPPAISDDEQSDIGPDPSTSLPQRGRRSASSGGLKQEDEPFDAVTGDIDNDHDDNVNANDNDDDDDDDDDDKDPQDPQDDEDDDDDEEMDEDEYIVEKILSHIVDPDGAIRYEVKWEGYEKKADRTWETTENLREGASEILEGYLKAVGGEEKIIQEAKAGTKTKKRGRPSSGTPANGTKKRRNGSHPASATPPVSARSWKPPVGSWEDEIESIDACHDEQTGKLMVYLTWKNGHKTQHDTKVIYQRCPQKMLQYYERHVKIVKSSSDMDPTDD